MPRQLPRADNQIAALHWKLLPLTEYLYVSAVKPPAPKYKGPTNNPKYRSHGIWQSPVSRDLSNPARDDNSTNTIDLARHSKPRKAVYGFERERLIARQESPTGHDAKHHTNAGCGPQTMHTKV